MSTPATDPFEIEVFRHLFASVAEEMGVTVQRSAHSPNIKERRDHSCAVFDADGRMIAQAAHIPVHLGSMPASVSAAIEAYEGKPPTPGDVLIVNDPYLGGTHLPDITTVSPAFVGPKRQPRHWGWVATRAHHADVGGLAPGSMPPSTELFHEGLIIPPLKLVDAGELDQQLVEIICRNVRTPEERRGDLEAQLASHRVGESRLAEFARRYGAEPLRRRAEALLAYSEKLAQARLQVVPDGTYGFTDVLDDDGAGGPPIPITVTIQARSGRLQFDFTGTGPAAAGALNAPEAVTRSAVIYVARCLMGDDVPANDGATAPLEVIVPPGTVLNPPRPHAVAAGNVETSQRVVDVLWGALTDALPDLVPAASQGTMNNLIIGGFDPRQDRAFTYYETIAGGAGAGPLGSGADAVQVAMTNTLNTPIEAMELAYPLAARRYEIRRGSGGSGRHRGGDGVIREIETLVPSVVTIVTERRLRQPWGAAGGEPAAAGLNRGTINGSERDLPGKAALDLAAGDVIRIETPGGGGWGASSSPEDPA
ncbi:MAG: hydantoinase B/oxoprolinase family protein [Chloroflexota bacterium]|nr:hydantoinase B/oxoprolinase family protein [Chloroflexota bacterium]MDE2897695.1 hydantoinase B/oxoprolinase family protein [Chloroflexota bacterium]